GDTPGQDDEEALDREVNVRVSEDLVFLEMTHGAVRGDPFELRAGRTAKRLVGGELFDEIGDSHEKKDVQFQNSEFGIQNSETQWAQHRADLYSNLEIQVLNSEFRILNYKPASTRASAWRRASRLRLWPDVSSAC